VIHRLREHGLWAALALAIAAAVGASAPAIADDVDGAAPLPVAIGVPSSPAPVERCDLGRTNRSRVPFPLEPSEIDRRTVGSFAQVPIATGDGGLVVALSSPELLRLGPAGEEVFRTRLGPAQATRPPVMLPDGGLAVLTAAPSIVFVSKKGRVEGTIALPKSAFNVQSPAMGVGEGFSSIAPTADGAVAVAALRSFMIVEASGAVRTRVDMPEPLATDLVLSEDAWLFVATSGSVYEIRPPAAPKKVGAFPGMPMSPVVLADRRTLVAQVAGSRLVSVDLASGNTVIRASEQGFATFDAAFALDAKDGYAVTTSEGFLVRYDAGGAEISRTPVDRNAGAATPLAVLGRAAPPPQQTARGALATDERGDVAFARPAGRFGVRAADGTVRVASERVCQTPTAIVPLAPERLVVVCREGTLLFYGAPK
jgi:hypothetical protein